MEGLLPAAAQLNGLNVDIAAVLDAFRAVQLENEALRQGVLTAETERDQQIARAGQARRAGPVTTREASTATTLNEDSSDDDFGVLYAPCARVYSLTVSPWILKHSLTRPRPAIDPKGLERWVDEQSRADGIVAELFDMAPVNLHQSLALDSKLGDKFRDVVNHQRSQSLNVVKSVVDQIFSAYPQTTIDAIAKRKYDDPAVAYLLKGDMHAYEFKYPPVVFPLGKVGKMKYVYRSEVLTNIARVTLWGRTTLRSGRPPRNNVTGKKWGICHTTPGLIGYSVQVARFLLSPDPEFSPEGEKSGIQYFRDHEYVKEWLMAGLAEKGSTAEQRSQELLKWWDAAVFSNVSNTRRSKTYAEVPASVLEAERLLEDIHPEVRKGNGAVRGRGAYVEVFDDEGEYPGSNASEEEPDSGLASGQLRPTSLSESQGHLDVAAYGSIKKN